MSANETDLSEKLQDVSLVWGTPGSIEQTSDGGSEYASGFRLTGRGVADIIKAIGAKHFEFAYMEFCDCKYKRYGDGIHVDGEPSDTICLASPIRLTPPTSGSTQ